MEIHQALTRSESMHNILCRHEQGEIFAAEGYAKTTGKVGVCIATSGPGATNLVTGLADAMLDSVPLVAITGQVSEGAVVRNVHSQGWVGKDDGMQELNHNTTGDSEAESS